MFYFNRIISDLLHLESGTIPPAHKQCPHSLTQNGKLPQLPFSWFINGKTKNIQQILFLNTTSHCGFINNPGGQTLILLHKQKQAKKKLCSFTNKTAGNKRGATVQNCLTSFVAVIFIRPPLMKSSLSPAAN